jgi:hypothetical protein
LLFASITSSTAIVTMQTVAARSFTGTALRAAVPTAGKVRTPNAPP